MIWEHMTDSHRCDDSDCPAFSDGFPKPCVCGEGLVHSEAGKEECDTCNFADWVPEL